VLQLVLADEDMQDLIDETHGIDIAGRDGLTAEAGHALRKTPGGGKICQKEAPIQAKEGFIEGIFLTSLSGNVEFKLGHG
jgi:hypothetical protein